jgi:hypothetical protein
MGAPDHPDISTTLIPDPAQWSPAPDLRSNDLARASRAAIGLDPDRPVIASGHQPTVFHPGIVAKLIALDTFAKRHDAQTVWIVPDQDIADPASIRVPVQSDDDLTDTTVHLAGSPAPDRASATLPPIDTADTPRAFARLAEYLGAFAHEPTRAKQFASAVVHDLCDLLDLSIPTLLFASDLLSVPAARSTLTQLTDDPRTAIEHYNRAIESSPSAGVRPLALSKTAIELPLWRLTDSARTIVTFNPAEPLDPTNLVPRGILMTAIVRRALCDLFIHGTAGYKYDTITTRWINTWLNEPIAPITAASATLTLDLKLPDSYIDPDTAAWEAHHAKHDPDMLDEHAAAQRKSQLVSAIESRKSRGDDPSPLFTELQSLLTDTREKHEDDLADLQARAKEAQRFRAMHRIATDRTFAYPLHDPQRLRDLKHAIESRFA